jgi:molybdopterin-guanine dinucleotide biosynthesis protein A
MRGDVGPQDASGFILAGGQSSRMGSEKALALFDGNPLIQIAVQTFAEVGIHAKIAGARTQLNSYAPQIPDTYADAGPLAGVHAALAVSHSNWNLFLPVDLPLMPSSLLVRALQRAMLTGAPVTAVELNGILQPFPVILTRETTPHIEHRLQANQTACHQVWRAIPPLLGSNLDSISVEVLVQANQCRHSLGLPPCFWFQSANTPSELQYLTALQNKAAAKATSNVENLN